MDKGGGLLYDAGDCSIRQEFIMLIRTAALLTALALSACAGTSGSGQTQPYGEIRGGIEVGKTL